MAEFGYIFLAAALIAAFFAAVATVIGVRRDAAVWISGARTSIITAAVFYTLAMAVILYALAAKDFSLRIVSEHTSLDLPVLYSLSALYADKTGSILFWGWLVSLLAAVLSLRRHRMPAPTVPIALAVLAVIEAFFVVLTLLVANVFAKNPAPPGDGYGLNPLLQNFAMFIHPTLMYLGFAGFAVVFALVIASLLTRRRGTGWIAAVRRWAVFAWFILGIGNIIGMWWAYIELGWGGYWAWDPVENAGLMPWLLATAFLHSMAVRRQRRYLETWSLVLIILTFALTLLSPFITHGGIESPLHGFQSSPFPSYILAAILITLAGSLWLLYTRRGEREQEQPPASLVSKEGAFLLTNILLTALVCIILLGTALPGIINGLGGAGLALDRGFFDRTCGPLMLVLVFFMGVCPLLGWGRTLWSSIKRDVLIVLPAAALIAVVILLTGAGNWYAVIPFVGGIPLYAVFSEWLRGIRSRHRNRGENYAHAFVNMITARRARYGGFIVHIGVVLIAIGIVGSSLYTIEKTVTLDIDDSLSIGNYDITYETLTFKEDTSKLRAVAAVSVSRDGGYVTTMLPEYDYWYRSGDTIAEVAVRSTPREDLFVSLAWTAFDPADTTATFRILVNPLIIWIWIGGGLMLLGGIISFSLPGDKLERIKK